MTLHVLTAEGVSIAGVVGVYATEAEAIDAANVIWPQTDGYHVFVIYPMELGETAEKAFPYAGIMQRKATGPARVYRHPDHADTI